jgi:hypothetical protein
MLLDVGEALRAADRHHAPELGELGRADAADPATDLRGALTASRPISAAPAITTCGDEQA